MKFEERIDKAISFILKIVAITIVTLIYEMFLHMIYTSIQSGKYLMSLPGFFGIIASTIIVLFEVRSLKHRKKNDYES